VVGLIIANGENMKKITSLLFCLLFLASFARAQTAEIMVSLNEQFFDAVLDATFKNLKQPDFPLSDNPGGSCEEKVRLEREMNGVKTAVQFREGRIVAPIAFTGKYDAPLLSCLDFRGWAETHLELEVDQNTNTLFARANVKNVQVNNIPSFAGGVVARLLQGSIDRKINPVKILALDKLSFVVPVSVAEGSLKMNAKSLRYEVGQNSLNVFITYEFIKADG
jgi:hypothetical protein